MGRPKIYTDEEAKERNRISKQRYNLANKDKIKKWYLEHREMMIERAKKYVLEHPEKVKAYSANYRLKKKQRLTKTGE
jgi:hypothetical protein